MRQPTLPDLIGKLSVLSFLFLSWFKLLRTLFWWVNFKLLSSLRKLLCSFTFSFTKFSCSLDCHWHVNRLFCYFYISMHAGLHFAVRIMTENSAFEVSLFFIDGGGYWPSIFLFPCSIQNSRLDLISHVILFTMTTVPF